MQANMQGLTNKKIVANYVLLRHQKHLKYMHEAHFYNIERLWVNKTK